MRHKLLSAGGRSAMMRKIFSVSGTSILVVTLVMAFTPLEIPYGFISCKKSLTGQAVCYGGFASTGGGANRHGGQGELRPLAMGERKRGGQRNGDEELLKALRTEVKNEEFNSPTASGRSIEIAEKLHIDTRPIKNGLLDVGYVGYFMAACRLANPNHEDKVAVYGCSGGDWSSFILSTDANRVYFVDYTPLYTQKLRKLINEEWETLDSETEVSPILSERVSLKKRFAYAVSPPRMSEIERTLLLELKRMGVRKFKRDGSRNIKIVEKPDGSVIITFEWAYSEKRPKVYSITYIQADVEKPNTYPESLKKVLQQGIDIFYLKASYETPKRYQGFLALVAARIKKGGYLMTDDTSYQEVVVNPDGLLASNNLYFTKKGEIGSAEMNQWEGFVNDRLLAISASETVSGYGWRLNIRQRRSEMSKVDKPGMVPQLHRDPSLGSI